MNAAINEKPYRKVHQGHNVKRLREILGVKQEVLAEELGLTQQSMSRIEAKEEIEAVQLEKIAKILNIPVDSITKFNEEAAINIVANTFQDDAMSGWYSNHYQCTFNPIEKVVSLYDEKIELLERLLKTEQEKNSMLECLLNNKK